MFENPEQTTPSSGPIHEMAGASKELAAESSPDAELKKAKIARAESIFSVIYTVMKKVTVVGAIYLVGYMGWSVAWLITPIILAVTREQWKKDSEQKINIGKAIATSNEKDVILARIDDLPAWVSLSLGSWTEGFFVCVTKILYLFILK